MTDNYTLFQRAGEAVYASKGFGIEVEFARSYAYEAHSTGDLEKWPVAIALSKKFNRQCVG